MSTSDSDSAYTSQWIPELDEHSPRINLPNLQFIKTNFVERVWTENHESEGLYRYIQNSQVNLYKCLEPYRDELTDYALICLYIRRRPQMGIFIC